MPQCWRWRRPTAREIVAGRACRSSNEVEARHVAWAPRPCAWARRPCHGSASGFLLPEQLQPRGRQHIAPVLRAFHLVDRLAPVEPEPTGGEVLLARAVDELPELLGRTL